MVSVSLHSCCNGEKNETVDLFKGQNFLLFCRWRQILFGTYFALVASVKPVLQVQCLRSIDMPYGVRWGTDHRGIQEGIAPRSRGVVSCPAREREAGSPEEVRATEKASLTGGNTRRFPLEVD